jgi:hypothetical protein
MASDKIAAYTKYGYEIDEWFFRRWIAWRIQIIQKLYNKRHKHKYEDKYEYLSVAEIIINKRYEEGDKWFFLYADIDNEKIYGGFTDEEFDNAVNIFIQNNYSQLITPLLKGRDEKGKKAHSSQSAMAEVKKRFTNYKK